MADKEKTPRKAKKEKGPKKRRWYNNLIDAYKITKRSFPWIGWVLLGSTVAVVGIFLAIAIWQNMNIFILILFALTLAFMVPTMILALLVKKAMYRQVSGTVGSVYAVITQIRRGWNIEEEPIAANRHQDLVWRLIGRPGVVLLAEGPVGRVRDLAEKERKLAQRVVTNLPVHVIYVGEGKGQVKLEDIEKELRHLPKALHRNEVPEVVNRIQAVSAHNRQAGIPHGIDPNKAKISRRAMRGR
ncbi:MAG: DUF4191 domain-containing protein [Actinomycetaceae bacterium]|nr:DUF4191 domain-containing protein [Actinomycetaceae bacterium]